MYGRTIFSSFKMFEHCKARYPNREIIPHSHIDYDEYIYFNGRQELRIVRNKTELYGLLDGSIDLQHLRNVRSRD